MGMGMGMGIGRLRLLSKADWEPRIYCQQKFA